MPEIRHQRLHRQHLIKPRLKDSVDVLKSLVAVQAQDYHGAKWALGQRTVDCTDEAVENAFADGRILRTHLMRPTWHFVARDDIRWLLELTAPRVYAASASYFRKSGLDQKLFQKVYKAFVRALEGGKQLTRDELREVLRRAGVDTGDSIRMGHIMLKAEIDGLICSGARKGKQFTYALLAERAPAAQSLSEDEALEKLAKSYFATRGPAKLEDFRWWSGLTMLQVKRAVEIAKVKNEVINESEYWSFATATKPQTSKSVAHLLPPYDEYFIAYKDRSAGLHPKFDQTNTTESFVFNSPFTVDGLAVGGWQRVVGPKTWKLQLRPLFSLSEADKRAVQSAAKRYSEYLGQPTIVAWE